MSKYTRAELLKADNETIGVVTRNDPNDVIGAIVDADDFLLLAEQKAKAVAATAVLGDTEENAIYNHMTALTFGFLWGYRLASLVK